MEFGAAESPKVLSVLSSAIMNFHQFKIPGSNCKDPARLFVVDTDRELAKLTPPIEICTNIDLQHHVQHHYLQLRRLTT